MLSLVLFLLLVIVIGGGVAYLDLKGAVNAPAVIADVGKVVDPDAPAAPVAPVADPAPVDPAK